MRAKRSMLSSVKGGVLALVAVALSAACAFPNEPDGFGEVRWGTDVEEIAGLVLDPEATRSIMAQVRGRFGAADEEALKAYSRPGQPQSFDGVALRLVVYSFYRGKLASVSLRYEDTTKSPEGLSYYRANGVGVEAPAGYGSQKRMESALRTRFGAPTEGASTVARFARGVGGRSAYRGDVTSVVSECSGSERMLCTVSFSSRMTEERLAQDLGQLVKQSASSGSSRQEQP